MRFWVVPHTHWDREWYLPFENLRVRLACVLDDVLDSLEKDSYLSFTLDGQAILLDDYVEARPERESQLRRLLASGRLAVGPAYVLPDEFLVGQEALVRNLLVGRQVCARLGATPMAAAYAPDTFGHVAQLPQILNGFGIDAFVFWRGLGDEAERLGAIFRWEGVDGSCVLAVRLLGGYAAHKDLGHWTRANGPLDDPSRWPDTAAEQISEHLARFRTQFASVGLHDYLICNGDDHEPMQADLAAMMRACEDRLPDSRFQVATLGEYVDALRWRVESTHHHAGELAGGYEACVVRGVNSTRMYLKQANEAAERSILTAEVLASLASLRKGSGYPLGEMRLAWRELLKNHPHDSLPGCSLDEVHRDMEQRFRSARQIAAEVTREALRVLADARRPARPWMEDKVDRSVVNPLPWKRGRLVELDVPDALLRARSLAAETELGNLPIQLSASGVQRRAVVLMEVSGFGSRGLRLVAGGASLPCGGAAAPTSDTIQNEYYRVQAAPNGTLAITDRRTGHTWTDMHWFQDDADRGDEYSFCPVEDEKAWDSRGLPARTTVRASGPLFAELEISLPARLPRGLRPGRRNRTRATAACPIRTLVRLTAGMERIEFRTIVENRAREHRLRVVFPAPESSPEVRAESAFAVLRRPARPVWNGRWREPPALTHHMAGVVAAGRLTLMSKGLPEYEAIPRKDGGVDLALSLLRCVGFLSWGDLETRVGAQEPHIPTPDAQCQGRHVFEYAISLMEDAGAAQLLRAAQDYRTDFAVGPRGPDFDEVVRLDGNEIAFAALKGAEDGEGVILRVYNPGAESVRARVGGQGLISRKCQMDETSTELEPAHRLLLRPGEIATVRLSRPRQNSTQDWS